MRTWWYRSGLGRRGLPRVLLVAALALTAGVTTAAVVTRANDLADAYGSRHSVPVAAHDLAIGTQIEEGDVTWRALPLALVSGDVVDEPVGRTVTATVLTGEAIIAERVGPDGVRGPMALAPQNARAVAIPVGESRPPVALGDLVDVLAVALDGVSRAQRIASSAVVVAVTDEAVTVAIDLDELPATARAALESTAVIALVGAG